MTDRLWVDIRYGARLLRRNPGFSLLVIIILALGIGANTAIFSAVSSVLLAPLPFPESDRMYRLLGQVQAGEQIYTTGVPPRYFHEFRESSQLIESAAAQRYQNLSLTGDGEPERVVGIAVSDSWLETLQVAPILGRGFDAREQAAGQDAGVVMIGYGLWQRRFGGANDVIGKTMTLNGRIYSVIGVMPRTFRFPYRAELWMPMRFSREVVQPGDLNVPVRLKPGVTREAFLAEAEALGKEIAANIPGAQNRGLVGRPFDQEFRRDPNNSISALLAAVGLVLLLASINVANLLLARSGSRTREVAIRTAIGASRVNQIRQLLVESLILSALAGIAGVALAVFASKYLVFLIPSRLGEVIQEVNLDTGVLLFALGVSVLTGLLFGLMPALRITNIAPAEVIKTAGRFGSVRDNAVFRILVITEVALAFVLLAGAGLMAQNFSRLLGVNIGYDPQKVFTVNIGLPEPAYTEPARRVNTVTQVAERVQAAPGITAAGITTLHPVPRTRTNTGGRLQYEGMDPDVEAPVVNTRLITPTYFDALGLNILRGRGFTAQDTETTLPVAVISKLVADRRWPGEDPIGKQIQIGRSGDPNARRYSVIGVVPDILEPDDTIAETVYTSYAQGTRHQAAGTWSTTRVVLAMQVEGDTTRFLDNLRAAVWEVDPNLTLFDANSMQAALAEPLSDQRIGAILFVGFATFGLLIAMLGTYGVIAMSVNARIPEFGVRLALGLQPGGALRLVLAYGMGLVLLGLLLGLTVALALSRFLATSLSEISAQDPLTFAVVGIALLLAGFAASVIPARRAMKVDPMQALRYE
ncbi:MAG: ABC transporter permease [Gammaproteobacteria bacterium]|nr:ABC transporter permease [Gammaproteobacteria bacterium]